MEHRDTVIDIHSPMGLPRGLEFSALTYTVTKKQKINGIWVSQGVDLLHKITGYAPRGCITAVMGPSGAGKSTFLDALAGRISRDKLKGHVALNGVEMSPSIIKKTSAYVMQDDRLFPMLTVYETLLFAADFRLGGISREEKRERVEKLMMQLGLTSSRNTYIGDEGMRGVSGGERRRVSIGVDIIHGPSVLFLDEPTSGLDSSSAHNVIDKVRDIARSGSIVILTIHQPSSRILLLLDHLVVLARGQLMYQGGPRDVARHLARMGRKVPKGENSIEFLIDVVQEYDRSEVGVEPLAAFALTGAKPPALAGKEAPVTSVVMSPVPGGRSDTDNDFDRNVRSQRGITATLGPSRLGNSQRTEIPVGGSPGYYSDSRDIIKSTPTPQSSDYFVNENDYLTPPTNPTTTSSSSSHTSKFANPFLTETWILIRRNFHNIRRTPELFLSRLVVLAVMGFMMATMFTNPKPNTQGLTDRLSFFIFTVCLFFFSSNDAVPAFIQERSVFLRESYHNAYRASSYALAGLITYLPFLALQAAVYSAIVWFALKLRGSFLYFLIVLYVSLLTTNSFVVFVSSVVPNFILGYAAVIAFTALFFLFCGYFLSAHEIPVYWKWMNKVSTMTYPYEGLLMNEYRTDELFATSPVNITGRGVLAGLHIDGEHEKDKWVRVLIMLGFAVLYRVLFYLILRFGSKNKRS